MVDERSMLRATFDRLSGIAELVDPWVVCNADHRHLVARELFDAGFKPDNVILEPVGRNTAPAAAAAAMVIAEQNAAATVPNTSPTALVTAELNSCPSRSDFRIKASMISVSTSQLRSRTG